MATTTEVTTELDITSEEPTVKSRQGSGIICTWQYEAGCHNMALNPTGATIEMSFQSPDPATTVGTFDRDGERVRLGPWSAVVWRS